MATVKLARWRNYCELTPAIGERFNVIFRHVGSQGISHKAAWEDDLRRSTFLLLPQIGASSSYVVHSLPSRQQPTIVRFAPIGFPSLWPFDTAFGGDDSQAKLLCSAHFQPYLHFFDALHAKLRPLRDDTARLKAYQTLKGSMPIEAAALIKRRNFQRLFEYDAYRLQQADNQIGTSIGRYVIFNFRRRRLFHSLGHPTVEIVGMIAREALARIGIQIELSQRLNDTMGHYQLPIHPLVAESFDLQWVSQDLRYRVYDDRLTFGEYHSRYINEYG